MMKTCLSRENSRRHLLTEIDGWIRNRLRYCIWSRLRREKKPDRKRKNLIRLGVPQGQAYAWSRTRMGGWAIAQSPILGTTITVERLKKRGLVPLHSLYQKVSITYNANMLFPVI